MPLDLEHTWQSVLSQLQMDMPKASFDTWVRDTHVVSFDDGCITIGTHNTYTRDWLESRLKSTVSRLLVGIMDRQVSVKFVVISQDNPDRDDVDHRVVGDVDDGDYRDGGDDGDGQEIVDVHAVYQLHYDDVVNPERIVALPGYFSRLVPEIGARNAWLYVGWRQSVWDGKRQDRGSKQKRVPVRDVIRFSGLSRRTFFRAVDDPSTWKALTGLVERSVEEPRWARGRDRRAHRLPNAYTVHMTLPLARQDAVSVHHWLEGRMTQGQSLQEAIDAAVQTQDLVGEILSPLPGMQEASTDVPLTVMEIVRQLAGVEGEIPIALQDAAEDLHRRITSAFGTILLTHYFLEVVIPKAGLTPAQAWLVAMLRDRCYTNPDTGEVRDEVLVRGGYPELAGWLGLNRSKTIWEWLRDESGSLIAFLAVLPGQAHDDVDSLRLHVRLEEPLFDGADDTIMDGANDTHKLAEMAPMEGANGIIPWREWHGIKHLNTSPQAPERITPTTPENPVAAPRSWVLPKILNQAHVHPKIRKELLGKNASVKAFVSWLLYACSPEGESIQNPVAYVLSSLRNCPYQGPGGAYDQVAALPPGELVHLVRWSVERAAHKYDFRAVSSGNELWDKAMGASERHQILLEILLGDQAQTHAAKSTSTTNPTYAHHGR